MKLNPKVTGALAWGGLVVILAVPAADMITKPQGSAASLITSDMDQVRTASVATPAPDAAPVTDLKVPAVDKKAPVGTDPVDDYVASGKKLPSYISDAPAGSASAKPAPTVKLVVPSQASSPQPGAVVEVASVAPGLSPVAPEPYPASKRPKQPVVSTAARQPSPSVIVVQPPAGPTGSEVPLIVDEEVVARREAAVSRVLDDDLPPSSSRRIDGDRLEEWNSGSLADYLEQRGLINDDQTAQAEPSEFDEDGFFLDDGPNRDDGRRVIRRLPRRDFLLF